jgi:hypothetical protein
MKARAQTADVAHRQVKAELWLHDADGRPLRPVTIAQAEALGSAGAAFPIVAFGKWKKVQLKAALLHLSVRTFTGRTAAALANPRARYDHDQRVCQDWTVPRVVIEASPKR